MKKEKLCPKCGKTNKRFTEGFCFNCYRKYVWKRKKVVCKRCERKIPHHAKGYCAGCYNTLFHLEYTKAHNYKKRYNLEVKTYKNLTKSCIICGFTKIVDLHHLDENKANNSRDNLIALCPNHHKMMHFMEHQKEIFQLLKEKGIQIPQHVERKNGSLLS